MGELLTLEEVGHRLKIKAETVRRFWILKGKLPAVKVGRQWRVDADALQAVLDQQASEQNSPDSPDAFDDLNAVMATRGGCTQMAMQDQLERETEGQAFLPPQPQD